MIYDTINKILQGRYELVMTCAVAPEQYDVKKDGEIVAYLRLRHWEFTASVPYAMGECVYSNTDDVGYGDFYDDHIRFIELSKALLAVHLWYERRAA